MIASRKGSSGNSGMILPDSGKSSGLRKTVSELLYKASAYLNTGMVWVRQPIKWMSKLKHFYIAETFHF